MISAYSLVIVIGWGGWLVLVPPFAAAYAARIHIRPVNGWPAGALAVNRM